MATEKIITYWLCPAEPARTACARLIEELATRFDAPVFEPHVTIFVTKADRENPSTVLEKVLDLCRPFRLTTRGLDSSEEFTKTLFIQFARDERLASLTEDFRRVSVSPSDYELNPHLSLIYKAMDAETKRRLARSIVPPFEAATFDTVKAVISPASITSRADVEAWQMVAERALS